MQDNYQILNIMKFNHLNLKNLLTITLLFVTSIFYAQTECETIAKLRQQKNGTEVIYTGIATTTFYGSGGILIQDETGYLYVKNGRLAEFGNAKVRTNMKITDIWGVFKTATNEEMTRIEIESNEDVSDIVIKSQNASFNITNIALNDILTNPTKYECQPIRLTDIEVIDIDGSKFIGTDNNKIGIAAGWDITIPARGTFTGYYGNNGTQGFVIPSAEHVIPTGYKTINDLKNAYETDAPTTELGLVDAVLVNYINKNSDGSAYVYVQQTDEWSTQGLVLHIQNYKNNLAIGDSIKGIKGVFSTFAADDNNNITGSKIAISSTNAQLINVINQNNKITTQSIDDIEYVIGWGTKNYEATLSVTPKGKIVKADNKYNLVVNDKYIRIEGFDVSQYKDANYALVGIIDAGFINKDETSIILRDENDIIQTNYTFNSIAEMKAAGEPIATGTTYTLNSKAIITHIYSWKVEDLNVYGIFAQDETAGLYIETNTKQDVSVGDLVNGISGIYHGYFSLKEGTKMNIISNNNLNNIKYDEVTMATLASNPEKYASRVVKLIGVGHGSRTENHYGETMTIKYLYQGEYTMDYDIWNYNLYEFNNIIGVFDYGSYQSFSIIPLSQNHIEKGVYTETNIENATIDNNLIFTHDKQIIAPFAQNIKVYNTKGQLIGETNNDTFNASSLQQGVYIVLTTYNNIIKTTKIINY